MSSMRPPPPSGAPPPYAFVSRVYKRSMRPIIFIVAGISALWSMLAAIGAFQDLHLEHSENQPKLAPISLALGIMYLISFGIELLGVISAFLQRLVLIRMYAYGSVLAALLVSTAALLVTIVHFTFKNELIAECVSVASNQNVTFTYGIWGPTTSQNLNVTDAQSWCNDAWSHDTFNEIISLIVVIILGTLFSALSFSYYRQMLDPSSPANSMRAPSNQVRMGAYPSRYNLPDDGFVPNLGYNYPIKYAPPPGVPPTRDEGFVPPYEGDKLPGYGAGLAGDAKKGGFDPDGKDDPFSDFDGPSRRPVSDTERDVTSGRRDSAV